MDKETLFVALSNQKGGVGKSAFTILLASYFHYVENLNVAVIDCDSPQHSLVRMRERDKKAIDRSDHYKQQMMAQWERIKKKAYPIIGVRAEKAREAADELVKNSEHPIDLVLVDLPGTVDAQGVFRTIVNMDYPNYGGQDGHAEQPLFLHHRAGLYPRQTRNPAEGHSFLLEQDRTQGQYRGVRHLSDDDAAIEADGVGNHCSRHVPLR